MRENHIIASFETTVANTDQGQLDRMAEQTKEELGIETAEFIADKGYESREDIEKCLMHGTIPNVGFKYDKDERIHDLEYIPAEIDEATRQSTKAEDIQKCLHAGILPACYEGTTISVQLQRRSVLSCFIRHEDGRVTCPMGRELFKHRAREHGTIYGSRGSLSHLSEPVHGFQKHEDGQHRTQHQYRCRPDVRESQTIRSKSCRPVFSRTTALGDRKRPARVRVTLRRNPEDMQRRKELAEHPFGTVKWYDGAHYFLCRGKGESERRNCPQLPRL